VNTFATDRTRDDGSRAVGPRTRAYPCASSSRLVVPLD